MPKGVGYAPGSEYNGKVMRKKEPRPKYTGGVDSWGAPAGGGTKRSHDHPAPSDYSKSRTPHRMGSGPMKMQGAKMNPAGENSMPNKRTKGVR